MNNVNYDIAEKNISEAVKVNPLKEAALKVDMVEKLRANGAKTIAGAPEAEEAPAQVAETPAESFPVAEETPTVSEPVAPVEAPVEETQTVDVPVNNSEVEQPVETPVVENPVPEQVPAVEQPTDLNTVSSVTTPEMNMNSEVNDIKPIEEQQPVDLMQPVSDITEATVAPAPTEAPVEEAPVINQVAGEPMQMPEVDADTTSIEEKIESLKQDFSQKLDIINEEFQKTLKETEEKLKEAETKFKDEESRRKMAEDRVEELTKKEVHADNIINEVKNMRDELSAAQEPVVEEPTPAPIVENPGESIPVQEQAPVVNGPVVEAPVTEAQTFDVPTTNNVEEQVVETPVVETPALEQTPVVEQPTETLGEFISGDNAPTEAPGARTLSTPAGAAQASAEPSPLDAFSPMDNTGMQDINTQEVNPFDNMGPKTV